MSEILREEIELREAVEPFIEEAYDQHMTRGGRRIGGTAEDDLPVEHGTLYPLGFLNKAVGLDDDMGVTPDLVAAVRGSFDAHLAHYEEKGMKLLPVIRRAMHVNTATEENLPWYHGKILIATRFSQQFTNWLSRWTAEESSHAELLGHWGAQSGSLDTRAHRRTKVTQLMRGIHVPTDSWAQIVPFTDPQEGLTFDAHTNTGQLVDSIGRRALNAIAGQEDRHQRFFRFLHSAMVRAKPEYLLPIIARTWKGFDMPGKEGIEDYEGHALQLAVHGVFTFGMVRKQQREAAEDLGLLDIPVKTPEAQRAQEQIAQVIDMESRLNRILQKKIDNTQEKYVAEEKAAGRVPVILGKTVIFNKRAKSPDGTSGALEVFPEAV